MAGRLHLHRIRGRWDMRHHSHNVGTYWRGLATTNCSIESLFGVSSGLTRVLRQPHHRRANAMIFGSLKLAEVHMNELVLKYSSGATA
jgi:hypothetical protein